MPNGARAIHPRGSPLERWPKFSRKEVGKGQGRIFLSRFDAFNHLSLGKVGILLLRSICNSVSGFEKGKARRLGRALNAIVSV